MLKGKVEMSKIIYLKDILLDRSKKTPKKVTGRPKLKPFKHDNKLRSSLVEKNTNSDEKQRLR